MRNDRKLQGILLGGLIVQILYCITAVGFYHPDQHFQIIEFSSYQLAEASGATSVWELAAQIRPTLQVYLFSAFVKTCRLIHIYDPYVQLTLLRLVFGLLAWGIFNRIAFHYFRNHKSILYLVLLLINLSCILPYTRTLYSSEIAAAVVFFSAVVLYDAKKNNTGYGYILLTGLLFSLAFYLRFQMAFGIAGFGIWMLLIERKYNKLIPLAAGFIGGIAINILLDYQFYHQFVFTPYRYYDVNIMQGKAADFGTSSATRYFFMLIAVIGCPPLSIFLFYYACRGIIRQYYQALVWVTLFFIVGHCFVGHKEERFLFPVLNVLPVITGWGLAAFVQYYRTAKNGIHHFLKVIIDFSIAVNMLVLILGIFNTYSQTVEFTRRLTNKFKDTTVTVYCPARIPFETESGLPLTFYRRHYPNMNLIKFYNRDSIRYVGKGFVATTFNEIKGQLPLYDSLGYKPVMYSSTLLWKINLFLQSKKMNTINDIWVLYKKE